MAAPGRALSARDKEKLKEKLALLQREYRKTVSRLQRAERAERVKSHVKRTVAEQNNLLLQAAAEEGSADPTSQVAPEASENTLAGSRSEEASAVSTPLVTFSLEPEVFSPECGLPESLGPGGAAGEHERVLGSDTMRPVPAGKLSRLSRSRRRGRPSVASAERREAAHDGDRPGHGRAALGVPQSPVFTGHGSGFETELDQSIPRTLSGIPAQQGSSTATPQLEDSRGPQGGKVVPGALSPLPGCLSEESLGPSLEHPQKGGIFATPEGSAVKDTVLPADIRNVSKAGERGREDAEDPCRTAPRESGNESPQERGPFGEPRSSGRSNSDSPTVVPGKAGSGWEAGAASPLLEEFLPATPTNSLLDSCTVVEGLLFPVEYYVRTTRRMSSCQRELNVAAVIQSQLGRRRRSQRGALAPSSWGLPASPPEEAHESGSGCPLESNENPGPGEGTPRGGGLTQRNRRGRRKGRGQPRRRPPSRGAQELSASAGLEGGGRLLSNQACRSEPQQPAENRGPARVGPAQSESSSASLELQAGQTPPGRRGSRSCAGALEPPSLSRLGVPGSLPRLPSDLALQEFHLPADEFGLLQSEKVRASATKGPEIVGADESAEHLQAAEDGPSEVLLLSPEDQPSASLGLHMSKLLLSPANAVLEGGSTPLESQLPTPLFPLVGATPAPQGFCDTPRAAPASLPQEQSSSAEGEPARGKEEGQCHAGTLCPEEDGRACREPAGVAVSPEARQELAAESAELFRVSAEQHDVTAGAPAPWDRQGEGSLQMASRLKMPTGSSCVDVSAVWWEVANFTELCIVTACDTSVTLWRRLDTGCWEIIHTWSFAEVPVFQLVPLPGAHSRVCVALGDLEIAELRLLLRSLQDGCLKQSLVKAGNIKAVLGLSGQRLVSSCEGAVEVLFFPPSGGSCRRRTLFTPEETTLAFAAVEGKAEALVGLTAANCVVLWNLSTGQLLSRMPLGYAYPTPVCHQAYSDSGLLFVVFSHPCAKENGWPRSSAFQVVAFNPKTARSAQVMVVSLPPGLQGRYLEGDVRDASAAAVLTSGAIAVWDLLEGECTALLPPSAEGSWSLVRWSVTGRCLLASQTDGSVCTYLYAARPPPAPERAQQDSRSSRP